MNFEPIECRRVMAEKNEQISMERMGYKEIHVDEKKHCSICDDTIKMKL